MDVQIINPVLEAMVEVLKSMAGIDVQAGKPELKKDNLSPGDVSGIMSLSSYNIKISVALTFPEKVIKEILTSIMPPDSATTPGSLADFAGELCNIVAGKAKEKLAEKDYEFEMSLPILIYGIDHYITHRTNGPKMLLPFTSKFGRFFIELCYEKQS